MVSLNEHALRNLAIILGLAIAYVVVGAITMRGTRWIAPYMADDIGDFTFLGVVWPVFVPLSIGLLLAFQIGHVMRRIAGVPSIGPFKEAAQKRRQHLDWQAEKADLALAIEIEKVLNP